MHFINPPITKRQEQIIIGTILGGSSIIRSGKGSYLSMRDKNGKWLDYKAQELAVLAAPKPFTLEKTNRWHSLCYPIFTDMKKRFYNAQHQRALKLESLELLSDMALTVWFLDAGYIVNKNQVVLKTHIWGEKGTKTIMKYFNLLEYEPKLQIDRHYYRIMLNKKFLELIEPVIPIF